MTTTQAFDNSLKQQIYSMVSEALKDQLGVRHQVAAKLHTKYLLTINDVCALVGCNRNSVYELIKSGKLEAKKHGRFTVIERPSFDRWVSTLRDARESLAAA